MDKKYETIENLIKNEHNQELKAYQDFVEYFELCENLNEIKLVFVGIDRYPNDYTGIPFCKKHWNDFNGNCSGSFILKSLIGYDFTNRKDEKYILNLFKNKNPQEYFLDLAKDGIVFLNCSYVFLEGNPLGKHNEILKESMGLNMNLLNKAENIILCGKKVENVFRKYYEKINEKDSIFVPLHPSPYNKNSKVFSKDFKKQWLDYINDENYLEITKYVSRFPKFKL